MKRNSRCFQVRLNLDNPVHRRAWTQLENRGSSSYSDMVADALCRVDVAGNNTGQYLMPEQLRQIIRDEMSAILRDHIITAVDHPEKKNRPTAEEDYSQDDLSVSMDFIRML